MLNTKKIMTKILVWILKPTTRQCNNCNDAIESGVYQLIGGTTLNTPGNGWFTMFVMRYSNTSNDYTTQLAIAINTTTPTMFIRSKTASQWGNWRQVSVS